MTQRTVLICAREPVIAALLGMLAELAQFTAVFPGPDERPEDALVRMRPLVVVVLDGALDSAASDLFFARAAKRRVGVALFAARGRTTATAELARARGVPSFETPIAFEAFRELLDAAAASEWWRRSGERRRPASRRSAQHRGPRTRRTADGRLVFVARDGGRWFVYDRRSEDRRQGERRADRRNAPRDRATEPDCRRFVNQAGETWECELADGELEQRAPRDLERQLARATRV